MAEYTPLVSVIMPAYNAELYIEEAIRSVLGQSVSDLELIIIDDCSTDGTAGIIRRLAGEDSRIRAMVNDGNMGVARTRNRGLDLSRGSFVAFIDSDDVWEVHKLQRQLDRLRESGAGMCYCSYCIVDSAGQKARNDYLVPAEVSYEELLRENCVGCSTVVLTAELARTYRFKTDFYHEDYVLWLQILQDGHTLVGCTELLARWRFFESSRSFNKLRSARNRWAIYRRCLGLPIFKSAGLLCSYTLAGLKKYR